MIGVLYRAFNTWHCFEELSRCLAALQIRRCATLKKHAAFAWSLFTGNSVAVRSRRLQQGRKLRGRVRCMRVGTALLAWRERACSRVFVRAKSRKLTRQSSSLLLGRVCSSWQTILKKVLYVVNLHRQITRALTFENFVVCCRQRQTHWSFFRKYQAKHAGYAAWAGGGRAHGMLCLSCIADSTERPGVINYKVVPHRKENKDPNAQAGANVSREAYGPMIRAPAGGDKSSCSPQDDARVDSRGKGPWEDGREDSGSQEGEEQGRDMNTAEGLGDREGGGGLVMAGRQLVVHVWIPVLGGSLATRKLCVMLIRAWLQWALLAGHTKALVSRATKGVARALLRVH